MKTITEIGRDLYANDKLSQCAFYVGAMRALELVNGERDVAGYVRASVEIIREVSEWLKQNDRPGL